jgi:hypothetical protein
MVGRDSAGLVGIAASGMPSLAIDKNRSMHEDLPILYQRNQFQSDLLLLLVFYLVMSESVIKDVVRERFGDLEASSFNFRAVKVAAGDNVSVDHDFSEWTKMGPLW